MFKLPFRTWILNAASVFAGHHGAVTEQAQRSGCSRQTVYQHARKVEQRLGDESAAEDQAELRAEVQRLQQVIAGLELTAEGQIRLDKAKLQQLVVTAFAMGISLRQIEDLLGVLLASGEVPDHSTLGRWVQGAAQQAGQVLEALDPGCAARVGTLALDEIFFGGDRPWWGSSRRA